MTKIKMKVGIHEFEAEGSEEYLANKFEAFKELVEKLEAAPQKRQAAPGSAAAPAAPAPGGSEAEVLPIPDDLGSLFAVDVDKKRLSIRVHIDDSHGKNQQVGDALLMLLYAHKKIFQLEEVGAVPMGKAIKSAVGQNSRIDHAVAPLISGGFITRHGNGRATTYGLTPKGSIRAEAAIRDTLAKIQA
ncbi:MAG: hypothetical protein KGL39_52180 [Patescibacteria group bacterium]|nr:hypothetical protein [Patescibacteria group bacterium]